MTAPYDALASLLEPVGRTKKPRPDGITIILDKGIGSNAIRDLAEVCGAFADYAKIAWASAVLTPNLEAKVKLYSELGVTPLLGGTLFEYVQLRGTADRLLDFVRETK